MRDDQIQRVRAIQLSMDESARPGFNDKDIQQLNVLVRLTVQFYDYLSSAPPSDEPFRDMNYVIDSIFFNLDSFRVVMNSYGILVGSTTTTIDWNAISTRSLKEEFVSVYDAFVSQSNFESKCRLLLDLVKLQIVFAGVFYDCLP
jgi:hypothetical protein